MPQPIELRRALNLAKRLTGRPHCGANRPPALTYQPGVIVRESGYAITMAKHFAPFAASRHRRASYAHLTRGVLIGWHCGRAVGMKVMCWCHAELTDPDLLTELPEFVRQCRMCEFRISGDLLNVPRSTSLRVTVEQVNA
jgi:hypothetical protein